MVGLRAADPGFALTDGGDLTRGGELIAELDISLPGSGVFEDAIGLFREQAGSAGGAEVAARLGSVTAILAARLIWQGRTAEETLDQLGLVWDWLTASKRGLVHADGEGFGLGHRRPPLRCADQVGLARHEGQSLVRGTGFRRGRSCSTAGESGRWAR